MDSSGRVGAAATPEGRYKLLVEFDHGLRNLYAGSRRTRDKLEPWREEIQGLRGRRDYRPPFLEVLHRS